MLAEPQWSPASTNNNPELSVSTSSPTSSPRSHLSLISASSSLASSFSDISSSSLRPPSPPSSKTHAFFASPFASSTSSAGPATVDPPKSPSPKSSWSLNTDFFASPPRSAQPTPPPSIYPLPSRDPSPSSTGSSQLSSASHSKPRLPPLARFFPSRYNSAPSNYARSTSNRDFFNLELELDDPLAADGTPRPSTRHDNSDIYFDRVTTDKHHNVQRVFEEDEDDGSHAEFTTSPNSDDPQDMYPHALKAGTVISGEGSISFSLIRALGHGAFSSVWLAHDNSHYNNHHDQNTSGDIPENGNGRLVAVKVAPRDNRVTTLTFEREAEVLRHISHRNIIPLLHSFSTTINEQRQETLIHVLPYIPGGDLLDLVNSDSRHGRMTEGQLKRIVRELVDAVGWLHFGMGNGLFVVHRDVKLENILLTAPFPSLTDDIIDPTETLIKLTDFGLSRIMDTTSSPLLSTRCGSEAYAAPELVVGRIALADEEIIDDAHDETVDKERKKGRGWYDGRETDAWAVGAVIYTLVCRALPFGEGVIDGGAGVDKIERGSVMRGRERERKSWLMKIAKGDYEWPSPPALLLSSPSSNDATEPEQKSHGTQLAHLPQVRKVVEQLLVRDRKKRATLREVRDDEWFKEEQVLSDLILDVDWSEVQAGLDCM